jgi:mRNA interferase MazF
MQRGEVWWVDFDERRPVLLLSDEEPSGFQAIHVVAPASTDITGVASEIAVGNVEGLPFEGVVRVALPRPDLVPCTWLTTLSRSDLLEPAGALPLAKLEEITDLLHLAGLDSAQATSDLSE